MKRAPLLISCGTLLASLVHAVDVTTPFELNMEIENANAGLETFVEIDVDLLYNSSNRVALLNSNNVFADRDRTFTITGDVPTRVVDSNSFKRTFFVHSDPSGSNGTITISNLVVTNGRAQGGMGSGGGLGAGGGLFLNRGANVVIENLSFVNCQAVGGDGIANMHCGGGGMEENGGAPSKTTGGGGAAFHSDMAISPGVGEDGRWGAGGSSAGPYEGVEMTLPGGDGGRDPFGNFGGGGGGGIPGGDGGFGAGGGFGGVGGTGGFGAGSNGGGGAGLGGAIFMREGSTLTLDTAVSFMASTVSAGGGANPGQALGTDIFMMASAAINVQNLSVNSSVPNAIEGDFGAGGGLGTAGGIVLTTGNTATLTLNGDNTYSGVTEINSGELNVNGSVITPITVNAGGAFGGNATLAVDGFVTGSGDLTVDGGIVRPGGDAMYGNIFVGNDLIFMGGGSFLNAEVDSVGNTDFIGVKGAATIGGSLEVQAAEGNFIPGQTITLLTAAGGLTGTFDTERIPNFGGVPLFSVLYTSDSVLLVVNEPKLFEGQVFTSGNSEAVANYLNSLCPIDPNSPLAFAVNVLGLLPNGQLNRALNTLHPGAFGTLDWMNLTNNSFATSIFSRHNDDPCCEPRPCSEREFWIVPYGIINRQHHLGQLRGFHSETFGIAAGIDCRMDTSYVGFGFGYTHTDFDWSRQAGTGKFQQVYGGVYGSVCRSILTADFVGLVGLNDYDIKRFINFSAPAHPGAIVDETAKSWNWGMQATGHLGLAADLVLGGRIPAQLFAMGDYFYLKQDSFKEKGAPGLNLKVKQHKAHMVRTELGLELAHTFNGFCGCWEPYGRLSWVSKIPLGGGHYTAKFVGQSSSFRVNTTLNGVNQIAPEVGLRGSRLSFRARAELNKRVKVYFADIKYEMRY